MTVPAAGSRRRIVRLRAPALFLLLFAAALSARAAPCESEDFQVRVSGVSQCLVMRRFGVDDPEVLLLWIHGDVSSGGPADYHFARASQAAGVLPGRILSVALVRPGYSDGSGNESSVALTQAGRSDHYTRENIAEVGAAIERLRARFKPRRVVVVGHSGGAATTAVLLGMKPGLIDGAVLVACPCDIAAWRSGRRAWSRSESPILWVDRVDRAARVVALTGDRDDNTAPELARAYVAALTARGIDAVFRAVPGESHNGAFRSPEVLEAVRSLSLGP